MKTALALTIVLPFLGSVISILLGRLLPRRAVELGACSVVWASFAAALFAAKAYSGPVVVDMGRWLSSFSLKAPVTVYLDSLSLVLCLMITFVCGLIHLYSIGYMSQDRGYIRYFALLNLFTGAMLVLVLAENLPLLYLGWEGVGFCSYALIGFWYEKEENATAGRKAFIVTRIGDVGLALAIFWMFDLFGTLSITQANQMGHLLTSGTVTALGFLLLLGAAGKSAQVPLMVWLPDAMAGPTPVSAQIHAATMVTAGVYLLMRMFPLVELSTVVVASIALVGTLTAFYGASCALVERDIKRILAYSTISQIGYMMLAVGSGAIDAAAFHLVIHAFFKALLFLAAGCVINALHHQQDIFQMGGLRRSLPRVFWPFLAGALCLAGVPPTGGFFSKDAILSAVWARNTIFYGGLYLVALLTVLLTVIYTFRMVFVVFGGDQPSDQKDKTGQASSLIPQPPIMVNILIPLALLGLAGGMLNLPGYLGNGLLNSFLAPLDSGGRELSHATELTLQGLSVLAVIAGIAIAWLRYGGRRGTKYTALAKIPASGIVTFLRAGWYADTLYGFLFVRPYRWMATIFWLRIDEGLIDDSLDRIALELCRLGRLLGRWGSGRVSLYMASLAAGAALMIGWFALEVL
ncbi:MAG: NADH-quinone oxidoreductase subunit L [Desulforhopalus sp.]